MRGASESGCCSGDPPARTLSLTPAMVALAAPLPLAILDVPGDVQTDRQAPDGGPPTERPDVPGWGSATNGMLTL